MASTTKGNRAGNDMSRLRRNGLGLAAAAIFFVFLLGQSLTGVRTYNSDQREHHQATVGYWTYLTTGDFGEAVFENWESEFLQVAAWVMLTVWLYQQGSSESKPLSDAETKDDDDGGGRFDPNAPWPVRRGGV